MDTPEELRSPSDSNDPVPPVKAKMRAWREKHPQEAAERGMARQQSRARKAAAVKFSELIGPEMVEKAAERLDELLNAEAPVVIGVGQGMSEIEMVPDNRTRLEAVKVVAAYTDGTPIARQFVITGDFRDLDAEKRAVLLDSPAVQEALRELEEDGELAFEGA